MPGDEHEQRWTVRTCVVCGRTDRHGPLKARHYSRGELCRGEVVPVEWVPASRLAEAEAERDLWRERAAERRRGYMRVVADLERAREALEEIGPVTEFKGYAAGWEAGKKEGAREVLERLTSDEAVEALARARVRRWLDELHDEGAFESINGWDDVPAESRVRRTAEARADLAAAALSSPELSADGGSIRTEQEPDIESETRDGD